MTQLSRREALTKASAAAAAVLGASVTVQAHDEEPERETICFLIKYEEEPSKSAYESVKLVIQQAFEGTKWEGVPMIALFGDVEFEVIRKPL